MNVNDRKILFRCDGDEISGWGHFSRCINLARHFLEVSNSSIYFLGIYSSFAKSLLEKYEIPFFEIHKEDRINPTPVIVKAIEVDLLILDSYLFIQDYLDAVNRHNFKTVYISDTSELNYKEANLVVNFRMEGFQHSYQSENTLLSIDYFITKPEFREIREQNKKKQFDKINNILLFNSGALTEDKISHLFLKTIDNNFNNITVNFISKHYHSLSPFGVTNNEYHLIKPTFEIEKYYKEADIVLSGGGLTKYESAYCLIPNAATSSTLLQQEDSVILQKKGLCYNLGYIEAPKILANLEQNLSKFLTNRSEQKRILKSSLQYFNTNSTFKLCHRILSL